MAAADGGGCTVLQRAGHADEACGVTYCNGRSRGGGQHSGTVCGTVVQWHGSMAVAVDGGKRTAAGDGCDYDEGRRQRQQ